ncbi:hypothetical protein JW960_19200 [candidate division KSB1 bacterium]|nr:hypothetical protein [candidate division KSB1 bacterium]
MRTLVNIIGFMVVISFITATSLLSVDNSTDKLVVQFSNPDQPGSIKLGLVNGGITVTGYDGKDVIVEATSRSKSIEKENVEKDAKGMFRIPISSTGLEIIEEDNEMEINVESWKRTIDVTVKAPFKTNLELNCVNAGDIYIEKIDGEIDVDNTNGKITLNDISGSVVANALNKDIFATLNKVNPEKPMSFSTLNGDIDVTFPANIKASVKLKSDNGEIYSDYEIQLEKNAKKVIEENKRGKGGAYHIEIEKWISGTINGGGQDMSFTSFNGDIFIRKNK